MRIYKIKDPEMQKGVEVEQKVLSVTEEVVETREGTITVAQLKEKHSHLLKEIRNLQLEANEILGRITEIEVALDITVTKKPKPLVVSAEAAEIER